MKNAKLRVLGVTTKEPTALAPGQPPIAQALPGYAFPGWYGAFMPLKTPRHIVARLHKEFARTMGTPEMRERLLKIGVESAMSTPAEFREFLNRESKRMDTVLREARGAGEVEDAEAVRCEAHPQLRLRRVRVADAT